MPQSRAANSISSQEGGSRCQQVTWGWHGLLGCSNPSTGRTSHGKLTGNRNYPLKTHFKWKNILDITSRLFYRLANVTNVLGEQKNPKLPVLQVSQVVFAGNNCPDWPFFKALHLKQSSPFTEQKDKLRSPLSHAFQHLLNSVHSCSHQFRFSPVLPTPLLTFLLRNS